MPLTPFQKASFRQHIHNVDQVIDDTGSPITPGGGFDGDSLDGYQANGEVNIAAGPGDGVVAQLTGGDGGVGQQGGGAYLQGGGANGGQDVNKQGASIYAFGGDMTGHGKIVIRSANSAGTAGQVLTADGAGAAGWATPRALAMARAGRTAGNVSTSSSTPLDIPSLAITLTTGAHRCLVIFNGTAQVNQVAGGNFSFKIDGVDVTGGTWISQLGGTNLANVNQNVSFSYLTDVLSAGSHVFQMIMSSPNNTSTVLLLGTAAGICTFSVMEQAS